MGEGVEGTSIDTARGLALQLIQSDSPQRCSLARIYRDALARPVSEGLQGLLLDLEKSA
jgi:hypothetical protein